MKKIFTTIVFLLLSITIFGQIIKDTLYYDNGVIKEIRSFNDKTGDLHGQCVVFSENNDTIAVANYLNGKKHGQWIIWRKEDRSLAYELYYNNGLKVGVWKYYNEKGQLMGKREY